MLERQQPDLVFLQELKCRTEEFPTMEFEALGYRCHAVGQPGGRNGVAVLSRIPFEVLGETLPGEAEDDHARFIEVRAAGMNLPAWTIFVLATASIGLLAMAARLFWLEAARAGEAPRAAA